MTPPGRGTRAEAATFRPAAIARVAVITRFFPAPFVPATGLNTTGWIVGRIVAATCWAGTRFARTRLAARRATIS